MEQQSPIDQSTMDTSIGLAIDTTFDDTSIAILSGHRKLLANCTLSQHAAHAQFGGVVPERASRCHLEVIHQLIDASMQEAGRNLQSLGVVTDANAATTSAPLSWDALDYVAVSHMPGLRGAILVGLVVAKSIALRQRIPLIGINHIHAHPYANWLHTGDLPFPLLHLVVAGGHTLLIHQQDHFHWEVVGRSVDDAAGECLDKVAKMWGYPMPGGKTVDSIAAAHAPGKYVFPKPMWHSGDWHFSFSGLKTALRNFHSTHPDAPEGPVFAAFFNSVAEVLVHKTMLAAKVLKPKAITLSGGVAASRNLCERFANACHKKYDLYFPPPALCTDNAAMVACLASYHHQAKRHDTLALSAKANL